MTNRETASKNLPYGYYACAYDVRAKLCENPAGQTSNRAGPIRTRKEGPRHTERSKAGRSDSGLFSSVKNCGGDELWTNES